MSHSERCVSPIRACEDIPVQRAVTASIDLTLAGSIDLIFSFAVAQQTPLASEHLTIVQGDRGLVPVELIDQHGGRIHRLTGDAGPLTLRYDAVVDGRALPQAPTALETITYLRPSRYAQSDELFGEARRRFSGLGGHELLIAVTRFVEDTVVYSPGLSKVTDSAVTTLASGTGVCRDYAHLVVALLRAMDVPARYVSVYAPGLRPMDFHAVAEAYIDGAWFVVDATRLANRHSLVRIGTGRDAADVAFLSYYGGNITLDHLSVDARLLEPAETAPAIPETDDFETPVQLA